MMKWLAVLFLLFPLDAFALSPGDTVTVYFKDGSSVQGSLVQMDSNQVTVNVGGTPTNWSMASILRVDGSPDPSTMPTLPPNDNQSWVQSVPQAGLPNPPPPNGYASSQPPQQGLGISANNGPVYVGVPFVAAPAPTQADQDAFLKQQAEEREARKHQITTPESDLQFNLQQALDRQAHGLPFNTPGQ